MNDEVLARVFEILKMHEKQLFDLQVSVDAVVSAITENSRQRDLYRAGREEARPRNSTAYENAVQEYDRMIARFRGKTPAV